MSIIKINANQQSRFIKKHPSVLINSTKLNTLTHHNSIISDIIHTCLCVQVFIYMFQISLNSFQHKRNKKLRSVNAYAPDGSLSILPVHENKVAHCVWLADGTNENMQTNVLGFEVHPFISYETVKMS